MTLRKLIFWLHLIAGVFAGTVVLIMSLTGVLLMYQKQITAWMERAQYASEPPAGSTRLSVAALTSRIRETQPAVQASAITFYSDPREPALVTTAAAGSVYVNPYTGAIFGEGSPGTRTFFRHVTDWHRWLAMSGTNRNTGRAVTGVSNLAFLFIVVSGLYLWFPRRWTLQALRVNVWFRKGLSGRARNFNWHNVFGFWTALPLFFVVLSGVVISYPWATDLVYRVTGTEAPAVQRAPAPAPPNAAREQGAAVPDLSGVDELWSKAEASESGWTSINLRLPVSADAPLSFLIDRGNGGQPQLRSTLVLDRKSGAVVRWEKFEEMNTGRRLRSWLRFVHTGEFYGFAGQTIAGIASGAGVMLVCTGFLLVLKRFQLWRARRVVWGTRQKYPSDLGGSLAGDGLTSTTGSAGSQSRRSGESTP